MVAEVQVVQHRPLDLLDDRPLDRVFTGSTPGAQGCGVPAGGR